MSRGTLDAGEARESTQFARATPTYFINGFYTLNDVGNNLTLAKNQSAWVTLPIHRETILRFSISMEALENNGLLYFI